MQNLNVNFSSLNADRLTDSAYYQVSRANYDAYLFFRTEYHHVFPIDEGTVIITRERKFNLKRKLSDMKEKLFASDSFLAVSPNSSIYPFLISEYRENSFTKDFDNNFIVPTSALYKTKTRK